MQGTRIQHLLVTASYVLLPYEIYVIYKTVTSRNKYHKIMNITFIEKYIYKINPTELNTFY